MDHNSCHPDLPNQKDFPFHQHLGPHRHSQSCCCRYRLKSCRMSSLNHNNYRNNHYTHNSHPNSPHMDGNMTGPTNCREIYSQHSARLRTCSSIWYSRYSTLSRDHSPCHNQMSRAGDNKRVRYWDKRSRCRTPQSGHKHNCLYTRRCNPHKPLRA